MRFTLVFLIWFVAVGSLIWLLLKLRKGRVPDTTRMAEWARNENVDIVWSERRWFLRGPYFSVGGPTMYRVRIRDHEGTEKDGWIGIIFRIPGFETEVEWTESKNADVRDQRAESAMTRPAHLCPP